MSDSSQLVHLLSSLANPSSPQELTSLTELLQSTYQTTGVFNQLHQVALNESVPRDARVLASLVMKNEMVTRWRVKIIIPEEDKQNIRARFFQFLTEPDVTISQMQFWTMSKISRLDYPRSWPDLMQTLKQHLLQAAHARFSSTSSSTDRSTLRNTLWLLNRIIKEWVTVRLPIGTKSMGEFLQLLLPVLIPLLDSLVTLPREVEGSEDSESAMLCFKLVARLIGWEWARPASTHTTESEQRFAGVFSTSIQHLTNLMETRNALIAHLVSATGNATLAARAVLKNLTRHVGSIIKFFKTLEEHNPKGFVSLPSANEIVIYLWKQLKAELDSEDFSNEDQESSRFPTKFKILSLLLYKNILPIWATSSPPVLDGALITETFNVLVVKILPLSVLDLETLADEPEEWCVNETAGNEQWTYDLRPCGERVLLALNNACRNREDRLMDRLMQDTLAQSMSTPITDELSLRRKEAVYAAAGRLARSLVHNPNTPPTQFILALTEECKAPGPEYRVLKRRVAWLIGELVDAEEELAQGSLIWELLIGLISDRSEGSDIGVRLTAATSLKQAMDLWELDSNCFTQYISQIADGLFTLLGELELLEGRRRVIGSLEVLIERVGLEIVPYIDRISQAIPTLWSDASSQEGQWLFKSSLLTLITKLVESAKTNSSRLSTLCIQLLGESLRGGAKVQLEEDAMLLWQAWLRNTSTLDAELIQLVPAAIEQLTVSRDQVEKGLGILDSYMLLDGQRIYQEFAVPICAVFKDIIMTSTPADVLNVLSSLAIHVQIASASFWAVGMNNTALFTALFKGATAKNVGNALPYYTNVFAEMILRASTSKDSDGQPNQAEFFTLAEMSGVSKAQFLDFWWDSFDRIARSSIRKRVALASAALCPSGDPDILSRFRGEFVNLFLDVLGELKETELDGAIDSSVSALDLHWKRGTEAPTLGDAEGTAEGVRLQALFNLDPVYTASLKGYVREKLAETPRLAEYVDIQDPAFIELQAYLAS